MLFDHVELAQIVVDCDAGVVDEDIEGADLIDCPLDLRNTGHVQCQGRHAFVGVLQCAAGARVYPLRPPSKRLIDERPTDAAVGAGDQDCLLLKVHTVLLSDLSVFNWYLACPPLWDASEISAGQGREM